jgi:hypothetical protein
MTPMTLINARLILEAKRELAHSTQSVKQIAHGMALPMSVTSAVFSASTPSAAPASFASRPKPNASDAQSVMIGRSNACPSYNADR